jgi:hypothetical protein
MFYVGGQDTGESGELSRSFSENSAKADQSELAHPLFGRFGTAGNLKRAKKSSRFLKGFHNTSAVR